MARDFFFISKMLDLANLIVWSTTNPEDNNFFQIQSTCSTPQ